ncbi:hypothetical protein [Bacillus paramycoides]|uniref:hypothetical protein n=1 Tax=Bacillus paramycoides TaxID=2026194 RepID=UPI002E22DBBD|nr:hypothetical protein [Bacillus paramycoides]
MIEKWLRLPLFQIILLILVGLIILEKNDSLTFSNFIHPSLLIYVFITVFIIWIILMKLYNRTNPYQKFNIFTLMPTELREDDEGLRWITFQACRNVYIYYSLAIPIGIGLISYFNEVKFISLLILVILGLGQYIIYWLEIKKIYEPTE